MVNYIPGYYWIYRHKGQQFPEIARLTKNGWDFIGGNNKMGKPYEVLCPIEPYSNFNSFIWKKWGDCFDEDGNLKEIPTSNRKVISMEEYFKKEEE